MKIIPIKAACGITGFESPAATYTEQGLTLDELLIEHPSATFIGRACGDSMRNVGIMDNDILIVDRAYRYAHLDVVVANYNGNFVCKIIDIKNKRLISGNESEADIMIHEHDEFVIEGVVTRSIRLHKPSHLLLE
ncbi:translesion error-prone DNA polymerase V autoproteolytic subunit [Motilimonas sp. E26]|uniref:translesion error-prone DNA polymerase V autoproteolytic subunit n=1 Tax=Motilimonas sp. E26 TaxID=2865674 RepID=UPI001E2D880D|nr:translesion error-prone DNA polymerase V autoproteolytic subunit [Motilimonas sp. E26]MCE0555353.1 translesion error-prone DNA polymerase V autoproteolytic subunit [Motilimonas sp. E26]